jgi:hypothetical protein
MYSEIIQSYIKAVDGKPHQKAIDTIAALEAGKEYYAGMYAETLERVDVLEQALRDIRDGKEETQAIIERVLND